MGEALMSSVRQASDCLGDVDEESDGSSSDEKEDDTSEDCSDGSSVDAELNGDETDEQLYQRIMANN